MFNILLDLPNFLIILLFIVVCYSVKLIPAWLALALGILSSSPFFINDFIFPASYMPDQFRYLNVVQHLRNFDFNHGDYSTVKWSAWMMAFLPLPLVETIKSLGFFNRFAVTALIIWLYAYKNIRGLPLCMLLVYPSFILYSSLTLRDTLIFIMMMLAIISYIDKKFLTAIVFALLLFLIKFQNFFLIITFFVISSLFTDKKLIIKFIFLLLPVSLFLILNFQFILESINFYRIAMYLEDGGDDHNSLEISSFLEFFTLGVWGAFYFIFKPFIWEASGIFQMIQALENVILVFFLFLMLGWIRRYSKLIFWKWIIFLLISFMIYGLVVFNFGTAARYRFPFLLVAFVGIYYDLKVNLIYKKYFNRRGNLSFEKNIN